MSNPANPVKMILKLSFVRKFVIFPRWFQWTQHPVGPASAIRRILIRRARHRQPLLVNLTRLLRIDKNITRPVVRISRTDTHCLVPAVHPRDGIGVNGKSHVLVYACTLPPDAQRVCVAGLVWLDPFFALEGPLRSIVVQLNRRHQLLLTFISEFPATHVTAARNNAGTNALRHPDGY